MTSLSSEVLARIREQVLQEHPEMEGAELSVKPHLPPEQDAVAAKLGLPLPKSPPRPLYVVTLRKQVQTEDGVTLPLTIRLSVDAEGCIAKDRQSH